MTKGDTAGVIAPPPLIYLGFLGAGWLLERFVRDVTFGLPDRWGAFVGISLVVIGFLIEGEATMRFRRAETAVQPWKPSDALVTAGIYRVSRNPIYIGFGVIYTGLALLLDSPMALALLFPCLIVVDRGVIAREERYLEAKFGESYRAYARSVRRWL